LFGGTAFVIELRHRFGSRCQVRHDETDPWEEFTSVPPDFGDDPTCLILSLGLIQKTVIEHLRLEGGTAQGAFHQVLDFTVQNVVRR
jgi:hypothetical protein